MSVPFDVFITSGGQQINLRNAQDLNIVVAHNSNGPSTVDFQMCDFANKLPDLRSRIALRHRTYGYFWSGYAGAPRPNINGPAQITARGWQYTTEDNGWDASKTWDAGTPLKTLVDEALVKCSHISSGISFPGGLTTTQLPDKSQDFKLQTPRNVFDYVTTFFNYLATPLIWQVKQNPVFPMSDDPCLEMKFTDTAPRYRVRLGKDDEFTPQFDADVVFNAAMIEYGDGLFESELDAASLLYQVIQDIRYKRVNVNNDVTGLTAAQALVRYLLARNNTLRPVNATLKISCNTPIEAIPPAVPTTTTNVFKGFVFPHYGIRILNNLSSWGVYGLTDYYIVESRYDAKDDSLTLVLGDPIFYDSFNLLLSYITNRGNMAIDSSVLNEPQRRVDEVPVYGPTTGGTTPATTGAGIPIHYLDKTGALASLTDPDLPTLRNGAGVHPYVIPDYGVQANFGREAASIGIKGYIRVIPCRALDFEAYHTPPPGSTTIPTDGMVIWLHNTYPFTAGNLATRIAVVTIPAASAGVTGTFATPINFAQGGKIGVEVVTAASTANSGFQIGIGGKKIFPDLGVTT